MRTLMRLAVRLIILGLLAAVGGAIYAKSRLVSRGEPEDETVDLVAIFEGFELESRTTMFRGGSLLTWFGGGTLDLRNATLAPEGARLTVRALFGGAEVIVPEGWDVVCELIGLAGGLGDDREREHAHGGDEPHRHTAPGGPVLTIDGWAAFGGIGITSQKRGPVLR